MSVVLATSALMLGLAGGPHCAVMCGALQAGAAHRATPKATRRALWSLHLGRFFGYTLAGALVAASVSLLASVASVSPALRPFWTLLQVGALCFGLYLVIAGKVPAFVSQWRWPGAKLSSPATQDTAQPVRFHHRLPADVKAIGVGLCWTALPCGLLQSAMLVSAMGKGAVEGAAIMAAFAIGTSISLVVATSLWSRLGAQGIRWSKLTLPVRVAGAFLALGAGFSLFHISPSALIEQYC